MGYLQLRRYVCVDVRGFEALPETEMGTERLHKDEISQRQHADWKKNRGKKRKRNQQGWREQECFKGKREQCC